MRAVTRHEIEEIDRRASAEFGIPATTLMENAGRAVARIVLQEFKPKAVTVVCGKGKNGGDGFVAARHIAEAGVRVHVHALAAESEYSGISLENFRQVRTGPLVWSEVVVDAIFGTGLTRPVEGKVRDLIEEINRHAPIVAVDIPSGLDADTGRPLGAAVRATLTVTMGLPKVGLLVPEARPYVGRLIVADIGYPRELVG
ncbi:MAG: NAD(P)H-hydrate epimerase [Planctomycetes bacterium]|nr:NAD(P)H-hydrate epimerase [Planctomycetota bacterium]